jgi:hypothetical protein
MIELLEKLETVLQSEVDMHATMIVSSQEFNAALRSGDLAIIDRQRIVQDEAICKIEHLETQRMDCCTAAAEVLGIIKKPLRLTQLLDKIPNDWRTRLEKVHSALKGKINELTAINISNRILLEEGLKMLGNTFSIVRQAGKKYAGYGNQGQVTASPPFRSIINRTV